MSAPADKRGIPTAALIAAAVLLVLVILACCVSVFLSVAARGLDFGEEPDSDSPSWEPGDVPADFRAIVGAPMPASARNCRYTLTAGIDVYAVLRCDLSASEVPALMASAGLTRWTADRVFTDDAMWLDFGSGSTAQPWWTPPSTIDEQTYVSQRGSVWRFARHDGTTLWWKSISH